MPTGTGEQTSSAYADFFASAGEEITSIALANFGSFNFETDNLSYQEEAPVSSTPTPEPGSFLLTLSGLGLLVAVRKRYAHRFPQAI